MSTITKDLGVVTAYGYAVTQGYTGTEEEFAELMASYATVAEQAAQSAETAEEAAQAAAQAVLDANAAKTAAQTAQTAAESASTTATNAATSASNSATSAASSASTASTAATTATEKAQEAATSATSASESATDANAAKTAAQTAKTDAETAQGKAEEAQAKAEEAAEDLSAEVAQIETNKNDIADLKSDISYEQYTFTDYIADKYINNNADIGETASLTVNNLTSYKCALVDVMIGDSVTISGLGGNVARLWCLVDGENKVISKSDANYTANNDVINITVDGKLACNFYNSVTASIVVTRGVRGVVKELYPTKAQTEENTTKLLEYFGGSTTEALSLVVGYVDYSNGTLSNYDSANKYKRTGYIEIPSNVDAILTNCVGTASGGWAVYDENYIYITGAQTTTIKVFPNYKYIALSSFDSTEVHANKTITFKYDSEIKPTTISCWGDSITEGMYLDGNHSAEYGKSTYPAQLTTILTDLGYEHFVVNNYGHGGECMPDVSARLGSVCAYFAEDVTVAGDGTPTQIGSHAESGGLRTDSKIKIPFNNKNGNKYNVAITQLSHDTNPITINGKQFALSISNSNIYLSQTSGTSITIPKGSLFFTNDDRDSTIDIVYGGVNDNVSMTLEIYLKFMAKVAEKNPKYICIGCQNALFNYWSDVIGSTIAEKHEYYADACNAQMGLHFVDLYNEFYPVAMEYALDGGYFTDKTQSEIEAMEDLLSQKIMPAEFSYDGAHQGNVHLGKVGYYVMARIIYNRLVALNYV